MMKKLVTAGILALAVGTGSAYATGFPQTDFVKIATQIFDNLMEMAFHAIEEELGTAENDQAAANSEMVVDTYNNGFANAISRLNQTMTDIWNIQQIENAMPAPGSCSTLMVSNGLDEALCGEQDISDSIDFARQEYNLREASRNLRRTGGAIYHDYGASTGGRYEVGNIAASPDRMRSAAKQAALEALAKYDERVSEHLRNLEQHRAAGREVAVTRPDLTLITDSAPYEFTVEELDIAKSRNFIESPPFVDRSAEVPITERQEAVQMRQEQLANMANTVGVKHISLKAKPAPDKPSRLLAMNLASMIRLSNDAQFDSSNQSFLQTIAEQNPGKGATVREEMLMQSIRLNNMYERLKQSLAMEAQLAMLASARLTPSGE